MNTRDLATDTRILGALGDRISRQRLQRNLTQAELATNAGVSKRTIERLEAGESTQLSNFIRILRALDLLDALDAVIPKPLASPLEQLKLRGRERQRASSVRDPGAAGNAWTWKDES